jgi:ribonuclease E
MSRISRTRLLARFAAPVLLASALGACSSIPDWVDPTEWFGSDSQAGSDQSGDATADAAQTPDLASIPPKPAPPSTPDEQQQVANSLAADRTQTQYSAEALQGGTEPVAAPPPPQSSDATVSPSAPAAPADQSDGASAAPTPAASSGTAPSSDTSASTAENSGPPATAADTAPQPIAADLSGTQVASTNAAAATAPVAAPMAPAASTAPPAMDMQASFAPSHAPALDASVSQYVPQRILSRYQQTAAAAAVPGVEGMSAAAARPAHRHRAQAAHTDSATDTAAPAQ